MKEVSKSLTIRKMQIKTVKGITLYVLGWLFYIYFIYLYIFLFIYIIFIIYLYIINLYYILL